MLTFFSDSDWIRIIKLEPSLHVFLSLYYTAGHFASSRLRAKKYYCAESIYLLLGTEAIMLSLMILMIVGN